MGYVFEIEPSIILEHKLAYYPFIVWPAGAEPYEDLVEYIERSSPFRCKIKYAWEMESQAEMFAWIEYVKEVRKCT